MLRWMMPMVLLLAAVAHAAPATRPTELVEVKTADDLQKQPLINVPGVGDVRLGIGPMDADLGPWRIVYCLLEKEDNKEIERAHHHPPRGEEFDLGRLRIGVEWERMMVQAEDITKMARLALKLPVVHQTVIPIFNTGKVTISVYAPGGPVIASTTMTIDKRIDSPWQQFAMLRGEKAGDGEPETVVAKADDRVVPQLETTRAWAPEKRETLGPIEPRLKLSLKDGVFTIDSGERKMIDMPDENLLARWWVNDKPATQAGLKQQQAAARAVRETSMLQVLFGLPDNLKAAKAGDKVTLQVMYCPEGFQSVGMKQAMKSHDSPDAMGLAVSNKLEITLTDAMLKPAR